MEPIKYISCISASGLYSTLRFYKLKFMELNIFDITEALYGEKKIREV